MSEFAVFLTATERCAAQCKAMLEFEQEKRQALLAEDMNRLESMIQSQQAAIMKLESLEKQRVDAQEKAGFGAMTATEILGTMKESPEKTELAIHIGTLRHALEEIRFHNEKSLEIARTNIKMLNALNANPADKKERPVVYKPGQAGKPGWQAASSFDKKY